MEGNNPYKRQLNPGKTRAKYYALLTLVFMTVAIYISLEINRRIIPTNSVVIPYTKKGVSTKVLTRDYIPRIKTTNGQDNFTISTWIYVEDLMYNGSNDRSFFSFGEDDREFNLSLNSDGMVVIKSPNTGDTLLTFRAPLQRWVHLVIVSSDSKVDGGLTVFIDGNFGGNVPLSTTPSRVDFISEFKAGEEPNTLKGISGYLGTTKIFNYSVNISDIRKEYMKGPVTGVWKFFGTDGWGLRTPIYRIDTRRIEAEQGI
jgi:hypothetical protein